MNIPAPDIYVIGGVKGAEQYGARFIADGMNWMESVTTNAQWQRL